MTGSIPRFSIFTLMLSESYPISLMRVSLSKGWSETGADPSSSLGPDRRCRTSNGRPCNGGAGAIPSASSDRWGIFLPLRPNAGILIGWSRLVRSYDALNETLSGQAGVVHFLNGRTFEQCFIEVFAS